MLYEVITFTVEIMEGGDMMDPNIGGEIPADMQMDNPKKSNKMKWWHIALLSIGVLGAGAGGFIVVKKVT